MSVGHVQVNRAPVLTLWAAVVAGRLGFSRDESLTMGRVVAGLNAYAKGKSLGLYQPQAHTLEHERKRLGPDALLHVDLLNRAVPMMRTPQGLRAVSKDKPVDPPIRAALSRIEVCGRAARSRAGDAVARGLAERRGSAHQDIRAVRSVPAADTRRSQGMGRGRRS